MNERRVIHHPVLGDLRQEPPVTIYFDGQPVPAYEQDTIASALLASGVRTLRYHEDSAVPRGIYCNIGHCYECRVHIQEGQTVRACLTPVQDGMRIESVQPLSRTGGGVR